MEISVQNQNNKHVNFGTNFRILTGKKKYEGELATRIGTAIEQGLAGLNAKITERSAVKSGDIIVSTSVKAGDVESHIKELTAIKNLIPSLSLQGHPAEKALRRVNAAIDTAQVANKYNERIVLDFEKYRS